MMIAMLLYQSVVEPCVNTPQDAWSVLSKWVGLVGAGVGFSLSELASFLKRRGERKREYRKFLADQANRLMEDIVRVFFGAKNELGYLASELIQIDNSIAEKENIISLTAGAYNVVTEEKVRELAKQQEARDKFLEDAYANLKKYHAQGEPSVKLLCSMPLKIDLSFLEKFLNTVTETYQFDTEGVRKQYQLYLSLHDEFISVRKQLLDEMLLSIKG